MCDVGGRVAMHSYGKGSCGGGASQCERGPSPPLAAGAGLAEQHKQRAISATGEAEARAVRIPLAATYVHEMLAEAHFQRTRLHCHANHELTQVCCKS
jgi:hypothetical protein